MASPEDFQKYHHVQPDPFYECMADCLRAVGIFDDGQLEKFNNIVLARAIDEYKEYESIEKQAIEEYGKLSYLRKIFTKPENIFYKLYHKLDQKF